MPWSLFHAQIHQLLRQRSLLPQGKRLLVAVSGGQDSLCLIRVLLDLQPKWNWQIAIVHCHHGWRSDAADNADYVEQLAQGWQVPFYLKTATQLEPTEAAARSWRYQVLTEVAIEQDYSYVVTGHTASDRAETLLYNLVRGSGADGLQALVWQRQLAPLVWLVRPLLGVTRAATAEFCRAYPLTIWQDSTNDDRHYARNRIRQELIPYLQDHFNPQVEQSLAQTAELLRADVEYLESVATEVAEQAIDRLDSPCPRLNRSVLRSVPLSLQRRVLRQFLQAVLPIAPSYEQIEKLVALIPAANRTQTDPFPGGAIAQVEGEWIVMHLAG